MKGRDVRRSTATAFLGQSGTVPEKVVYGGSVGTAQGAGKGRRGNRCGAIWSLSAETAVPGPAVVDVRSDRCAGAGLV